MPFRFARFAVSAVKISISVTGPTNLTNLKAMIWNLTSGRRTRKNNTVKSTSKRTILITASTYPTSNSDATPRFVHELALRLKSHYRVFVLTPALPNSPKISRLNGVCVIRHAYFFKSQQVLTHRNGMLDNLKQNAWLYTLIPFLICSQIFALRGLHKRIRPNLLNAHWIYPQGLAARTAKLVGFIRCPIIISVHGGDIYSLKKLDRLKSWTMTSAQLSLLVGKGMADYATEKLRLNPKKLSVRSMGVNLQSTFTVSTPIQRRIKQFIYVGRIAEKKGIPTLLEAAKILRASGASFNLTIIGGGDKLDHYKSGLAPQDLNGCVTFLGKISHQTLPDHLNEHTFFVFPSIVADSGDQEGMPLSPVEAQGCGCVVISSDNPAAHEYIEDSKTGIVFKMRDAEDLSNKMKACLELSEERLLELSHAGREHALKFFDWQRVADDYHKQFDRILHLNQSDTDSDKRN
jgi:glycosyltransferase involved in cell wall biosynthesis